ncbi:MAG: hypothetical protein ACKVWV_09500 [Planctomycetota bacterium]
MRALLWLAGGVVLLTTLGAAQTLWRDPYVSAWSHALDVATVGLAALIGPFAGPIARDWQSCCAENAWTLLPYAAIGPALALSALLVPSPEGRGWSRARLALWIVGWLVWFYSAILSLGHALE